MIEDYGFGRIVIDGTKYTSDIIIYPDGHIQGSWRRIAGHRLCADDIMDLIASEPQIIIAGTGVYGLMRPDRDLAQILKEKGIQFQAIESKKAAKRYNEISAQMRAGACFHLTC